ncbi:hypothetical protein ZWY2020_015030 [Hordeum vulgare]|nr:hypothetical protein ZWY2020_015030 [Hordeum vulgare]
MAILGYLMYGDDVESKVTLNLPEGKLNSKLAIYTALVNPFSNTVIVALTIPFFGHLMALVGSLLSVMASMLLPCICYLKIFGTTRCSRVEVALIVMIIVLGSLVAASGTYSSLQKIIHEF